MKKVAKVLVCAYAISQWFDLLGLKLYYLHENDADTEKARNVVGEHVTSGWTYAKDSIKKAWYKDLK